MHVYGDAAAVCASYKFIYNSKSWRKERITMYNDVWENMHGVFRACNWYIQYTVSGWPLRRSCSKGGRSEGMWNWADEMAANNLYTFSPSNGNLPVVKWNLERQQPRVTQAHPTVWWEHSPHSRVCETDTKLTADSAQQIQSSRKLRKLHIVHCQV